jgi:hypothetical protein
MIRNVGAPLGEGKQSNQRAELMAIKIALEKAPRDRKVLIRSDSIYSIESIVNWGPKWQRASWRKPAGIFVANRDLIDPIVKLKSEGFASDRYKVFLGERSFRGSRKRSCRQACSAGLEVSYLSRQTALAIIMVVSSHCVMSKHADQL